MMIQRKINHRATSKTHELSLQGLTAGMIIFEKSDLFKAIAHINASAWQEGSMPITSS